MWIEPLSEISWSVRVEYYHQSGVEFESMRKIDRRRNNSTLLHNFDFDIAQWVLGFNYKTDSKSHRKPFREEIKASFGDWILEWDANN